tara:strand:+ start:303 stop:674 length:372 start_codon:yes stop_codon:yes gene_type:complete
MFKKVLLSSLIMTLTLILLPQTINANEAIEIEPNQKSEVRLNQENWHTMPHPEPDTFYVTPEREVFGTTTTGIPFSQTNVPNEFGIRVQKFSIQDHYHYILKGGMIIYSDEELAVELNKSVSL